MERMEVEGQWWLLENSDRKVPGRLVISDDLIELSLLGALRHYTAGGDTHVQEDGTTVTTFSEQSMARAGVYPRILGQAANGKLYSLHDGFQIHRSSNFFGGVELQRITVHSVFEGAHLDEGELEFSEIVIQMDGLVQFVNRNGFREAPRIAKTDGGPVRVLGHTVSIEPVPTEEFQGLNGSICLLVHKYTIGGSGVIERHMSQDFALHVKFDKLEPLDDLLAIASHFQDLVSVATGRRAAFTSISLRHPDLLRQIEDRPPLSIPVQMYAKWTVRAKPGLAPLESHALTFTLDDLGGVQALTKWLTVADNNATSLARVMAARYSDTTYASDILLNAAAALEGYHRDKYNDGESTYFVNRIKRCVELAGNIFTDLVPDTDEFAKRLKQQRVNVAHHLNNVDGSSEQIFLAQAAAWLLIICLLRESEAPEEVFKKIIDRQSWRWLKGRLTEVLAPPDADTTGS